MSEVNTLDAAWEKRQTEDLKERVYKLEQRLKIQGIPPVGTVDARSRAEKKADGAIAVLRAFAQSIQIHTERGDLDPAEALKQHAATVDSWLRE